MNQKDKLGVLTGINQKNNNGSALLRQCGSTGSRTLLGNTSDWQVKRTQPTFKGRIFVKISFFYGFLQDRNFLIKEKKIRCLH